MSVFVETSIGNIVIDLYTLENPTGCYNFLKLCKMKYYQHSIIYRVIKDYAIQFGDPNLGNGGMSIEGLLKGDDHRFIKCTPPKGLSNSKAGTVGFVTHGKNKIASEIYITTVDGIEGINGIVIGKVEEGMDVVQQLNSLLVDNNDRPFQNVRIINIEIFEDPYEDPKGFTIPQSPVLVRDDHPEVGDLVKVVDDDLEEKLKENEARSRAEVLEMIGDLPFADIKPPENVMFVCKLNSCTTDSGLETVFEKFGKVVSAEVVRDRKSGNSLGYAFVEFEDKKCCEEAIKKMDNAIIDDRRIHVDYSQSIGKYSLSFDFIRRHNHWIQVNENDPRKRKAESTITRQPKMRKD